MKTHAMLNGSSAGLAAIINVDTTVCFLSDRQRVINLSPILPQASAGYVWSRVFQRRKG